MMWHLAQPLQIQAVFGCVACLSCLGVILFGSLSIDYDTTSHGYATQSHATKLMVDVDCLVRLKQDKPCIGPVTAVQMAIQDTLVDDRVKEVKWSYNATKDYIEIHYNSGVRAFRRFKTVLRTISLVDNEIYKMDVHLPENIDDFVNQYHVGQFLECKSVKIEERNSTQENARKVPLSFVNDMADFRDLLWRYNMTVFLSFGTLLGWRRECSIIPHTHDIDFAAFGKELSSDFLDNVNQSKLDKFHPTVIYSLPNRTLEMKFLTANYSHTMDLFFVHPNELTNSSDMFGMRGDLHPVRFAFPRIDELCAVDLLDRLMYVPCNVDAIVEASYGADWAVDRPNTVWDMDKNAEILPAYNDSMRSSIVYNLN